jgi:polar amino acid transport system substrate-binding protein
MRRFSSPIAAIGLTAAMFAAFAMPAGVAHAQDDPVLAEIKRNGAARIAIATAPPYAFPSPSGEPQGYLVEVVRAVMQRLGVPKLTATVTTWDAMIPGLQAKQFDFVPAGLNITSPRCQVVVFSSPITAQQDALWVPPGNPRKLAGYASVAQSPETMLAVLTGSSQEAFALKSGVKPSQLVKVPDMQAGVATVVAGRAHAFVASQFSVPNAAQRGVEGVVDTGSPIVGIGVAFRKDSVALRNAFNQQLEAMRASGELRELYATKYKFSTWDTLAKVTKASDLAEGCE